MDTARDDDALTWDGDDDPTLDVGTKSVPEGEQRASLPEGFTAVGRGSESVAHSDPAHESATAIAPENEHASADEETHVSAGNAALVSLGVLAGIYALLTIGWIVGGSRLQAVAVMLVSPAAYAPAFILAAAAPAIWFGTTMLLTRKSAPWLRFVWPAAGAILLLPWPFIMVGAVGV